MNISQYTSMGSPSFSASLPSVSVRAVSEKASTDVKKLSPQQIAEGNLVDEKARQVFGQLNITEWYLPTTGMASQGAESVRQPEPVFCEKTDLKILQIEEMIETSALNPKVPLPNLIFKGPPGVGKTVLAEKLCHQFGIGFIRMPSGVMESHIHNATHTDALRAVFDVANLCSQQVYIIMDDGEELVAERPEVTKKATLGPGVASWLQEQEAIAQVVAQRRTALVNSILEESGKNFRKIAFTVTTNRDEVIDGAFRARSTVLKISPPKLDERIRIIATHLPRIFGDNISYLGFFNQGRLEDMGKKTDGFTGRNIVLMLQNLYASVKMVEKKDAAKRNLLQTSLSQEIVDASIYSMRRSLETESKLYVQPKKKINVKTIKKFFAQLVSSCFTGTQKS